MSIEKDETDSAPKLFKGMEIDLTVNKLVYGGDGAGKYGETTVYVPYAIPGSRVRVRITEVKSHIAQSTIIKIITPSIIQHEPECKYFGICGGCDWMNMTYKDQKEQKLKILEELIEKVAGIKKFNILEMQTHKSEFNYRNRAEYVPVITPRGIDLGFYRSRSHEIIGVDKCLLLYPVINEIAAHIRKFFNSKVQGITLYNKKKNKGYLRHIAIRANREGRSLVTFVVNGKEAKKFLLETAEYIREKVPEITGIVVNFNMEETNDVFGGKEKILYGKPYIIETAAGLGFKLNAGAFFQVSADMLEKMSEFVKSKISKGESVLDLYGGVGALTLPLHRTIGKLTVVEVDDNSFVNLHTAVKYYGIRNAVIIKGRAEDVLERILTEGSVDTVVLDPPRRGMHPRVLTILKKYKVKKILYISCNPASFCRDISELKEAYLLNEIIPLDQFANTYHMEVMAELKIRK